MDEFIEYLYVTGQLDETFGLKDDSEEDQEELDEDENYGGRSR